MADAWAMWKEQEGMSPERQTGDRSGQSNELFL